jgi:NADH/F420H2 dehydrogenase subunit C
MMGGQDLAQALIDWDSTVEKRDKADRPAIQVQTDKLQNLMRHLRDDGALAFDLLLDHTAIDWVDRGQFELVYNVYSTLHGHYLMVSTCVSRENPVAPTVSDVWPIAHWQEREVFDMFGVMYDGHPDLRRLFLDDDWKGYPLRKDYSDPDMLEMPK